METTLPLPPATTALLKKMQQSKAKKPVSLADYPDLHNAATATKAELSIESPETNALFAAVEALSRLRLSATSAFMLILLAKHGAQNISAVAARMRHTGPSMTQLTTRLQQLELVHIQRGQAPNRRGVVISITPEGRRVLASLSALTGLGLAASALIGRKALRKPSLTTIPAHS